MYRTLLVVVVTVLVAVSCGGSEDGNTLPVVANGDLAAGSCLVDDPNCADGADGGAAGPLPSAIALGDASGSDSPAQITFGGFFISDGERSQLCSSLAESFPPQCGSLVIDIEAPLDTVLEYVAESFGNPEDAKININEGVYWTDDWVNLNGTLQANRLVLD